ncbi:hypothetical protein RJT34_18102 [Clitoria ternatea]|uniref:Uncharacterized protein n=1 Tax=Clitoria ternatea TaxID=43366 RepID=A0AAN9JA64_CLITE
MMFRWGKLATKPTLSQFHHCLVNASDVGEGVLEASTGNEHEPSLFSSSTNHNPIVTPSLEKPKQIIEKAQENQATLFPIHASGKAVAPIER